MAGAARRRRRTGRHRGTPGGARRPAARAHRPAPWPPCRAPGPAARSGSAPGSSRAARPAARNEKPSLRGHPQRPGEQAGHAGVDDVVVDEEVDHLVDVGREPAERGQLDVVDELLPADAEALRRLLDGDLAPFHEPGQEDDRRRSRGPAGSGPRRAGAAHAPPRRSPRASPPSRPAAPRARDGSASSTSPPPTPAAPMGWRRAR